MRFRQPTHLLCCLLTAIASARGSEDEAKVEPTPPAPKADDNSGTRLFMSEAVACRSIEGYESFELLPDASLTADEKLLVYYRPLNYAVEKTGNSHHVHLTQDGQIRRHGEKRILQRKEKLLEYEFTIDYQPNQVYLKNTISLKGLKPGKYEYDIILHDKLAKAEIATQSLTFRVVAAALPKGEADGGPDPAKTHPLSASRNRSRLRKASRSRRRPPARP